MGVASMSLTWRDALRAERLDVGGEGRAGDLRLQRRDEALEHHRRLARAGDARHNREPTLRECRPPAASRCGSPRWRAGLHRLRTAPPAPRAGAISAPPRPARNGPICETGSSAMAATVPSAMTWPPRAPASGPISTIQSASRRICVSWSTRRTEFPSATRSCITPVSPTMFDGCRPMDGSSSTYSTPVGAVAHGAGELHPLALAGGERRGGAVEREIPQPQVQQAARRGGERLADALAPWDASRRAGCPVRRAPTPRARSAACVQASSSGMPRSCGARAARGKARAAAVGADLLLQELLHALHALLVLDLGEGVFHGVDGVVSR